MVQIHTEPEGPRLYSGVPSGVLGAGKTYEVPSVTEILKVVSKGYLDAWRHRVGRKEADRVAQNATVIGSRVHAAMSDVALGREIAVSEDIRPMVEAGKQFLALHVDEVLESEWSLTSVRQGFGGTLDLYCRLHTGELAVVDFKTSKQLTRTVGHQLAAYALLLKEKGHTVNKRIGVRLKKEEGKRGEFQAKAYDDHRRDVRVFLAAKELWWASNSQKQDALLEWSPEELAGEDMA